MGDTGFETSDVSHEKIRDLQKVDETARAKIGALPPTTSLRVQHIVNLIGKLNQAERSALWNIVREKIPDNS